MTEKSIGQNIFGNYMFLVVIMFCYIFNFTLVDLSVPSSIFVLMGCAGISLLNPVLRSETWKLFVDNAVFLGLLILMGLYGAFLSVLFGDGDLVFASIFVKNAVFFYVSCVLGFLLKEQAARRGISEVGEGLNFVLDICFYAIVLQAFLVILTFINGGAKDFFANIIVNRGNIDLDHAFRFRGLHDSGGFTLGVMLGIGAVYGMYSYIVNVSRWSFLRILMTVIIICSTTLVARTGIVIVIIGLGLLLVRFPNRRHFMAYLLIVTCFLLMVGAIMLAFPEQYEFFNTVIFNYAFEAFVNYQSGAGVRTESSDDLKTMLFIPDAIHVIFGSGSYDAPSNGVERSDSGYIKTLLASGLLGFFVVYSVFAAISLRIVKALSKNANAAAFVLILGAIYAIIEVKSPVLYQNDTSRLFWLIYGIVLAYQGRQGSGVDASQRGNVMSSENLT